MEDELIVWGGGQTMFTSVRGPLVNGTLASSSGWTPDHHIGIDLHDRAVELRRPREWIMWCIVVEEPAGEWAWQQVRDGLVDVGRLPLDAVIYNVQQEPGRLLVGFYSKTGPARWR